MHHYQPTRFSQPGFDICAKAEGLVLDAFHGDLTETTYPTEFEEHIHSILPAILTTQN